MKIFRILMWFILGFAILFIYRITASPTIGWVDSGVIVAAAKTLGVANPPGFPLYMVIAHLFTTIPIGTMVSRLQFLSQVSAIGLVGLVYRIVTLSNAPWSGVFASITFAFSYSLWQQANNIETYTLTNVVLFALIVWALRIDISHMHGKEMAHILLIGLTIGLSMGLNPIIVAMVPAIIVWIVWNRRYVLDHIWLFTGATLLSLIAFIAIYSYLPLRASTHPFVNWGDPETFDRIQKHLRGAGLNIYEPETNSINGFTGAPSIWWESFLHYWHLAFFQFTPILFPLVVLGFVVMAKKHDLTFWMLTSIVGTNLLFVTLYYGGNQESWMVTSWTIMAVWMGTGVETLFRRIKGGMTPSKVNTGAYNRYVLVFFIIAAMVFPLFFWFPILNHADTKFADEYASNLYKDVPEGSIIIGGGDFFNSLTAYIREVVGLRKDIIPITGNMLYIFDWYRKNLTLNTNLTISSTTSSLIKYKSVDEFTDVVDSLIADNPNKQVFITPLLLRDSVVAGTKEGNYHTKKYDLVPHGLLLKVVPKGGKELPNDTLLDTYTFGKQPYYLERNYKNAYRLLRNDYAAAYQLLGNWWQERGQMDRALQALNRSIELGPPDSPEFVHRLAIFYAQTGKPQEAKKAFVQTLALAPDDAIVKHNYQNFLGSLQSATPSASAEETISYKGNGMSFSYPNKNWELKTQGNTVLLQDEKSVFTMSFVRKSRPTNISMETFINTYTLLDGKLMNQGPAKIPSFDLAYVRIFEQDNVFTMQFFLFQSNVVVLATVSPGNAPEMRVFDSVVTSLKVL